MNTKKILKVLNPLIWLINLLGYLSHLETQRFRSQYGPYNFSKDIPRF